MDDVLVVFAVLLLANVLAGLARVLRGPTPADRMLAAMLLGTTGVAILLVLAEASGQAALRDLALTFVLVAAVPVVVFRSRTRDDV